MADLPKFDSPEHLAESLRAFGARMHFVNRVAMGESAFAWWYAELLGAVARMPPLLDDKDTSASFGDGWTKGTVEDKKALLLEMLARELPDR
jgi:hypothetical protein